MANDPDYRLVWDKDGERLYETGVDRGVLYPKVANGYGTGVVWNGLTAVNENPSGGDSNPIWADNIKYLDLRANEEFGITIEAYTYPDEFAECDGSKDIVAGVRVGQQRRKPFGFSYRTLLGNDEEHEDYGYKIHLVYGCMASPSSKDRNTVNDSPEATTFSWEVTTTPVKVQAAGVRPLAHIEIDSTKVSAQNLTALENIIYGNGSTAPTLPDPDTVFSTLGYVAPTP